MEADSLVLSANESYEQITEVALIESFFILRTVYKKLSLWFSFPFDQ